MSRRFEVIVLPSTYADRFEIPNTRFFCRDKFESQENMPEAEFCHDMAFYLRKSVKPGPPTREEDGIFFRTDQERTGRWPIPPGNVDLSAKGDHLTPVDAFLKMIEPHARLHTDRMHVAILGCVLGREVHLYPNNYFKSRAVYESSMAGRFDVHFHKDDPPPGCG